MKSYLFVYVSLSAVCTLSRRCTAHAATAHRIYARVCEHIYVRVCIYIYICVYVYIHIYIYMHIRICTCVYAHRIYITVLVPLTSSRAQPLVGCDKQPHVHTTSESESDSQPRREREKERGKGRGFSSSILKRPPRDGRFDRVLNSRPP